MSGRIQHGRIGKYTYPDKRAFPTLDKPYFFKPTADNRRLRPYNKTRYVFNFSQWEGKTVHELAFDERDRGGLDFLFFIVSDKFDLARRPDLIIALRSLQYSYYNNYLFPTFTTGLTKRGFKRGLRKGAWNLSYEKTPFDHFIELSEPHKIHRWTRKKPDVTFDAEPLAALRPEGADLEQRSAWDAYPIRLTFYGVPTRIERLFIDDPEKKATYLTVSPAGIQGHDIEDKFINLTMKLDEEGREPGWAESMLGLPFHFSGALCSTDTVDLVDTNFEKVDDEFDIKSGLRFELRGTVGTVDDGKVSVKPDWMDPRLLEDQRNRETMHMTLNEGVQVPVVGEKYLIKGIIPPPDRDRWERRLFDWKQATLPDGVWKAFVFDRIAE
ncbi:hypothetical protein J4E85_003803 [Alternaria conjuncta]|uniref:uncharacterized protein n=1 Tax=Alternaria conjuncta TaxID=181017 RepID=UPI00221E3F32|nr:uncharacterized protein J4E85_003803 [Alternaria conjuncta]KAI4931213.1 hypothetical protein J4E85_003803 [Alternaria conjuncta]